MCIRDRIDTTATECLIHVYGDLVSIENNQIFAHIDPANNLPLMSSQTDNIDIQSAIRVESEQTPDGSQVLKHTEVVVKNNRIHGMRFGVHIGQNIISSPSSDYQRNVLVVGNLIIHHHNNGNNGASGVGIVSKPGTVVKDNTIIGLSQMTRGINVNGGNTTNATFDDRWSFIVNNIIRLNQSPIASSIGTVSSSNSEALCVKGNITSTPISIGGTATNRVIDGNVVTTVEPYITDNWEFHVFEAPF